MVRLLKKRQNFFFLYIENKIVRQSALSE